MVRTHQKEGGGELGTGKKEWEGIGVYRDGRWVGVNEGGCVVAYPDLIDGKKK